MYFYSVHTIHIHYSHSLLLLFSKPISKEKGKSDYQVITRSALKIIPRSCSYVRVFSSCGEGFSVRWYTTHCGNSGMAFLGDRRITAVGVAEGG